MIMENNNKTIIFTVNTRERPYNIDDHAQTNTSGVKCTHQLIADLQKYIDGYPVIKDYLTGPSGHSVEMNSYRWNMDNYENGSSLVSSSDDSDPYNGYYGFSLETYPIGYYRIPNSTSLLPSVELDLHDPCGDKGKQGGITIQTSSWTMLKKDRDKIILYDQLDQNNYLRF